jgi:hypothetical protein
MVERGARAFGDFNTCRPSWLSSSIGLIDLVRRIAHA